MYILHAVVNSGSFSEFVRVFSHFELVHQHLRRFTSTEHCQVLSLIIRTMFSTPPKSSPPSLRASSTLSTDADSHNGDEAPPRKYFEQLFEGTSHSPPHRDAKVPGLTEDEVGKRIEKLTGYSSSRESGERFLKLAWMVGVDMDQCICAAYPRAFYRYVIVQRMLFKYSSMGKRLDALFRAEGDETGDSSGQISFHDVVGTRLPAQWKGGNSDTVFTIFRSSNHPNVEFFRRLQTVVGNCFMHAPALYHWYKGLWQTPGLKAADNEFIHVSKWARHVGYRDQLFDMVHDDSRGTSLPKSCVTHAQEQS